MSYGGNGDESGFDLGFSVPEAKQVQEKIEEVIPGSAELLSKLEQTISDQVEDVESILTGQQLKIVGTVAAGLGDSTDRQERLSRKITPAVNQKLSEAQVPGLMVIREADHVFDVLLGDRTELITQIIEKVPQWRALLLWTWKNEVDPDYPNLTKKDFGKAGKDLWEAAIQKAKAGGVRNIASVIKKAQTEVDARASECQEGEQWIPAGPEVGDGYCTPVSDPEGDRLPTQPEQTGAEGESGLQGEPFLPNAVSPLQPGQYCIGSADGWQLTDNRPDLGGRYLPSATHIGGGYWANIPAVYIPKGDFGPEYLPLPADGWSWRLQSPGGPVQVDDHRQWVGIENISTGGLGNVQAIELGGSCQPEPEPQPVTEQEPVQTTEPAPAIYGDECGPVATPCIAVNCVTGIAPVPVAVPLDCADDDQECIEDAEAAEAEQNQDCEVWNVFYSPEDKGCYYRCDNGIGIRPNDVVIGGFATKEEADQVIADECSSRGASEIFYPGSTPRPYAQPAAFPDIHESYFCSIEEWVNKFIEPILAGLTAAGADIDLQGALSIFGINKQGRVAAMDNALGGGSGISGAIGNMLNNLIQAIYVGAMTGIMRLAEWMGTTRACFSTTWTGNFIMWFIWGLLAQYGGPAFGQLAQQSMYRVHAECPQLLPELQDTITMYLAGKITEKETMALTRLNNYCFEPIEKLIAARETQYTTSELLMLRMRGQLDEAEFRYEIRRNGMLGEYTADKIWDLHRAIPPISDLTRFMVRDVADDAIAFKYKWDKDFEEKWKGDVKRWSEEQGVNEYIAKAYWRAHWQMPAPSQLFEMLHRLSRLPEDNPAYTDAKTVDEALQVNDWPEYWRVRFTEISYRRLTRVDIRRAYMIGSIDRAAVVEGYQQLGYKPKEANILADFAESLLINRLEKSRDVKLYKDGVIDKAECKNRLVADGATPAQADKIIKAADDELDAQVKDTCAGNVRKRFLEGTLAEPAARAELIALPINVQRTNHFIELWKCELKSVDKKPTTSNLCKFKEQGLINDVQFTAALKNLGWDPVEIANIIKSCDLDIGVRQQRAIDQAARAAQAVARRAAADQKRKQNEAKAEQKAQKAESAKSQAKAARAEKAREAAVKANLRRQSVLVKASDKVAEVYAISLDDALYAVNGAWRAIKREYGFDSNKATEAIKVGVQALPKKDPPPFLAHMQSIAEGYDVMAT